MKKITLLLILSIQISFSQGYTEYLTGNSTDLVVAPSAGICMMGGASESDEAMVWFLNKANGGDVVVLRASGSDGYNDYFYSQLGVTINSVRTFVIDNEEGATNSYVLDKVEKAEAIWFAGGDQYDYVSFFKDNDLEAVLNDFINVKGGVIGGTSAGMAILGSAYFSAENGTVTNAQALSNPYHYRMTLGYNDFLEIPYLENIITDTHYDDPDRRARHSTFLARYATDNSSRAFGIACNEYTAVCVDDDGKAYVYGDYPNYEEHAFFIQTNCASEFLPESCSAGNPLNWLRNNEALKVYKVPGMPTGENYFDLTDWQSGSGGEWQNWYVDNGVFMTSATENPNCADLLSVSDVVLEKIQVYSNPFSNEIRIQTDVNNLSIQMFDILGKQVEVVLGSNKIDTTSLKHGIYFLTIENEMSKKTFKLVKN
ncbi:T9SS type A sorting domain-containing protein [Winogradskyella sp.]|jgi:cyanophycinase-like exopeptidase|uniref:T9SS type A sorting domain-containing protein n=1 Tax=Winogradskyella sp. TaxID=1883156 RepID=UPI0025CFBFE3|nr:T9SS type A sorting domain-containing protein [Winogradskyella sp.]MCT4629971.1 T9SS type A sorting domain-containing protein [Winogradskyella sp.]